MLWVLGIIVVFVILAVIGSNCDSGTNSRHYANSRHYGYYARDGRWYPYKETPSQYRSRKLLNSLRHF